MVNSLTCIRGYTQLLFIVLSTPLETVVFAIPNILKKPLQV